MIFAVFLTIFCVSSACSLTNLILILTKKLQWCLHHAVNKYLILNSNLNHVPSRQSNNNIWIVHIWKKQLLPHLYTTVPTSPFMNSFMPYFISISHINALIILINKKIRNLKYQFINSSFWFFSVETYRITMGIWTGKYYFFIFCYSTSCFYSSEADSDSSSSYDI